MDVNVTSFVYLTALFLETFGPQRGRDLPSAVATPTAHQVRPCVAIASIRPKASCWTADLGPNPNPTNKICRTGRAGRWW